jgi:hypothetical protein
MDVKMGAKTYGPDASQEKILKQEASYAGRAIYCQNTVLFGQFISNTEETKSPNIEIFVLTKRALFETFVCLPICLSNKQKKLLPICKLLVV